MNFRLPSTINQWHVEFDPYGFAHDADWLKQAERTEDILQLVHVCSDGPIIDLGFYSHSYRVHVIRNKNWECPVEVFESKSEREIENWIYSALERYANGFRFSAKAE